MKKLIMTPVVFALTGCGLGDALVALDAELSDGYFIAFTEIERGEEDFPGGAFHIVELARDRTGSSARFEGLQTGTFLESAGAWLEGAISVSPDGRFVAGYYLEDDNGVFEFHFGLTQIDPVRTVFSATDDSWMSIIDDGCGFSDLFAPIIRAQLEADEDTFISDAPFSSTFSLFDPGNVEWPTQVLGWSNTNKPIYSVSVELVWDVEQQGADGTFFDYEGVIQQRVYVTLATEPGRPQALECAMTQPALAPPVPTIHTATTRGPSSDPEILIDDAPLRTFLQPDAPFRIRGGTRQSPRTGVFEQR